MNFKKSFAMSPEMRNILPTQRNRKPAKNFLVENIKHLREMQLQMETAKKAMEAKAKKVQKPGERSPFTVSKGINNPLWVKFSPSSDETASGRSGGSGSVQSAHIINEKKSRAPLPKQLVDQGVQTSPTNIYIEKEVEESSHLSSQPSLGSVQPSSISNGPSVDSAHPSTPQLVQAISEPTLTVDNEAADMKEKAINKIWKETGVNFVELNRRMEYKRKVTKEKPHPIGIPPNYQLGELPRYLKEKKKTNSVQIKTVEEPSLHQQSERPVERPGYILLSDEERLEHLKLMKKCYEELLYQFNQLPIRCDSLRSKQKRADLEKQLDNLEKSMKLFSREKLYIKL